MVKAPMSRERLLNNVTRSKNLGEMVKIQLHFK